MSFEQRPKCKICGALHFSKDPHQFGAVSAVTPAQLMPTNRSQGPDNSQAKATEGKTDRAQRAKSDRVASRLSVSSGENAVGSGAETTAVKAATSVSPAAAAKQKRGRPATGFDRKAYQREAARQRRAKQKGKTP